MANKNTANPLCGNIPWGMLKNDNSEIYIFDQWFPIEDGYIKIRFDLMDELKKYDTLDKAIPSLKMII
jgi:hypothetical protein